jgi:hypothetical protein
LSREQLTFWWGEPHASPSLSQDFAEVSPTPAADSCLPTLRSLNVFGLDGLSGKMSPEFCHREEDGTLVPSSGRYGNWGMGLATGFWTLNGAEHTGIPVPSRSAGDVSSLSDVLETGPLPQRFSLSPKACSGILRRSERRQKSLPPMLKAALEVVVSQGSTR